MKVPENDAKRILVVEDEPTIGEVVPDWRYNIIKKLRLTARAQILCSVRLGRHPL